MICRFKRPTPSPSLLMEGRGKQKHLITLIMPAAIACEGSGGYFYVRPLGRALFNFVVSKH